jgi:cysteine desulfurase / selenocysteine lyase
VLAPCVEIDNNCTPDELTAGSSMLFNPLRAQFPFFNHESNSNEVYLDSAATTQKPQVVLDAMQQFYAFGNANVHRSSHHKGTLATQQFEGVRSQVQQFIHAAHPEEIIFTKGATESINLLANCLTRELIGSRTTLVVSALEHHANLVPWQLCAKRMGLHLVIMPVNDKGVLLIEQSLNLINADTALVAIGHVSNALGNINPIEAIITKARQCGALTLIDGAQAVSHLSIDVQRLDCDFYVFSGHKVYGPTGIGVLYGKRQLLSLMPPYQVGGEMIRHVSYEHSTFQDLPYKFEAGTPNICGVIGLGAALGFVEQHRGEIAHQEQQLYGYLLTGLQKISGLTLWGDLEHSVALQSFTIQGIDPQDISMLLSEQHIAIRTGHHCAMPLMHRLGVQGSLRISIGCYTNQRDIDKCLSALNMAVARLTGQEKHTVSTSPDNTIFAAQSSNFELAQKVRQAKGWDARYREIMLAGKHLTLLPTQEKGKHNEVQGCESQVWLSCQEVDGRIYLQGDSPSKIVRGLLAIIFEPLNGQVAEQIRQFDLIDYLSQLGLAQQLSQSRSNGLYAVVKKIMAYCESR